MSIGFKKAARYQRNVQGYNADSQWSTKENLGEHSGRNQTRTTPRGGVHNELRDYEVPSGRKNKRLKSVEPLGVLHPSYKGWN